MSGRVVVLASGSGSNLQALLGHGEPIEVVRVVVDRPGAGALDRAAAAGVDGQVLDYGSFDDRTAWERDLRAVVAAADPDAVVLAGFMRLLGPETVRRWPMLNVHPSLLPAFPGVRAVTQALAHGVKVTGVTVHLVDEGVDSGPIVAQEPVPVAADDTVASLHARIQPVEHELLPRCVAWQVQGQMQVDGRHVRTPADPSAGALSHRG
jgi:phosphoribosylglycinamide formyltransferase-1